MSRRRATITDVARAAGVSASTVSRSFTRSELLNPETRQRVLDVAQSLAYVPNRQARSLATGTTGNFGIVVPDIMNAFFPPFIKAAQARARENDRDVFLADSDEDPLVETVLLERLSQRVDGLLLCSSRVPDAVLQTLAAEMPVVLFNRAVSGIASVIFDDADGMKQAAAHLASLGHRRVAYVGGPPRSWSDVQRRDGLREAAEAHGLDVVDLGAHLPTWEAGMQAADSVLASAATAVVVFDDTMAMGLTDRLAARGVGVPQDVSVIGHDDIVLAARYHPSLTTIEVKCAMAGRVATDLLLRMPPGGKSADGVGTAAPSVVLPVQLMIRSSTGLVSGRSSRRKSSSDPGAAVGVGPG